MARPREFDEEAVLDKAVLCFWNQGYEATSVRDLINETGLTGASLYNAFGDKRALYQRALDHYVNCSVAQRIQSCDALPPREAIGAFFADIVQRSLSDPQHKGCMLVNAALELAPHDPEFQEVIAGVLMRIEHFFLEHLRAGQSDGSIGKSTPPELLAKHLLGVLMGVRVLARVRPEPGLLKGVVAPALSLLDIPDTP
ncbi:TetR/AcrR family transcriptional regulator [Pollutimonas sp. M17]|uniref:TetR/AcrR family transcriptional regulator n=1 Tax=Pollutimonas sp. M17 TaxID=2962065 RepID=UPI0021F475EA|nr:TetR/AcrR family transcriptional regulator [Pollutimonas sp. M17]UYO93081.1 TetR/AcrR family transcriptional regulator [Pollutimonas sp. M17]